MQHNNARRDDNTLKDMAECFSVIGWDKRLCDLTEEQVLGIVAKIQKMKGIEDEYTEQGLLEFEQAVSSPEQPFPDDPIPF